MTIIRMLSPEVLARLVAAQSAGQKAAARRLPEKTSLLLVYPDPTRRRKAARAERRHV